MPVKGAPPANYFRRYLSVCPQSLQFPWPYAQSLQVKWPLLQVFPPERGLTFPQLSQIRVDDMMAPRVGAFCFWVGEAPVSDEFREDHD